MGNIMAFNASGRPISVGNRLCDFASFLATRCGHQVERRDLHEAMSFCSGCGYCNTHDGCTLQDDLFPRMAQCDGFIFTAPIYFGGISGPAKAWIDRLYAMMDGDFKPRHPGKKVLAIYTQGDPRGQLFRQSIELTNHVFRMCGWEVVDSIIVPGVGDGADYAVSPELTHRIEQAVAKL